MIVLTGSGQCADQGLPSRAEIQEFCLKSTTTTNNVATSSKMYFFFLYTPSEEPREGAAMACARVPLDEQQATEPGPLGKERTLPALVSRHWWFYANVHSDSCSPLILTRIPTCAFCHPSAPRQDRGALFRALQAPSRRRLSSWRGGVFRTCQIHHRGPGVAACIASRQVLVSGTVVSTCYVEKTQQLALCRTASVLFCATQRLMLQTHLLFSRQ